MKSSYSRQFCYIKKVQQSPSIEIDKAIRYKYNYLGRREITMSRKFDDFLNEQLNDAEIRNEYEALQPEHAMIQAMIDAGQESGITQFLLKLFINAI